MYQVVNRWFDIVVESLEGRVRGARIANNGLRRDLQPSAIRIQNTTTSHHVCPEVMPSMWLGQKTKLATGRTYRACVSSVSSVSRRNLVAPHRWAPKGEERQIKEPRSRLHDRLKKPDLRTCVALEISRGNRSYGAVPLPGMKLLRWPREVVRLATRPATDHR